MQKERSARNSIPHRKNDETTSCILSLGHGSQCRLGRLGRLRRFDEPATDSHPFDRQFRSESRNHYGRSKLQLDRSLLERRRHDHSRQSCRHQWYAGQRQPRDDHHLYPDGYRFQWSGGHEDGHRNRESGGHCGADGHGDARCLQHYHGAVTGGECNGRRPQRRRNTHRHCDADQRGLHCGRRDARQWQCNDQSSRRFAGNRQRYADSRVCPRYRECDDL